MGISIEIEAGSITWRAPWGGEQQSSRGLGQWMRKAASVAGPEPGCGKVTPRWNIYKVKAAVAQMWKGYQAAMANFDWTCPHPNTFSSLAVRRTNPNKNLIAFINYELINSLIINYLEFRTRVVVLRKEGGEGGHPTPCKKNVKF